MQTELKCKDLGAFSWFLGKQIAIHLNLGIYSKEEICIHTPQVPLFLLRQPQGFIQLVVSRIWVSRKKHQFS